MTLNTAFLLMARYNGKAIITLADVCRDYFSHLTPEKLVRKVMAGQIALPIVLAFLISALRPVVDFQRIWNTSECLVTCDKGCIGCHSMRGNHHVEGRKAHAVCFAGRSQITIASRDIVIPRQHIAPKKNCLTRSDNAFG